MCVLDFLSHLRQANSRTDRISPSALISFINAIFSPKNEKLQFGPRKRAVLNFRDVSFCVRQALYITIRLFEQVNVGSNESGYNISEFVVHVVLAMVDEERREKCRNDDYHSKSVCMGQADDDTMEKRREDRGGGKRKRCPKKLNARFISKPRLRGCAGSNTLNTRENERAGD
ncbi:hypothetical protein OUZ56_004920 [Daphnia magna]|uniref:Uncharacterized protein n=1 Tax=Daphnia magna TaxID=35525 RepID=A0ABQ9YR98_9CRUS|nr:hypothetical protein OUZ56_004920 [Daphnia magna]